MKKVAYRERTGPALVFDQALLDQQGLGMEVDTAAGTVSIYAYDSRAINFDDARKAFGDLFGLDNPADVEEMVELGIRLGLQRRILAAGRLG